MKRLLLICMMCLGCILSLAGCGENQKAEPPISIIGILTYPERYEGEEISTKGVLKLDGENYALYVSADAAKYSQPMEGILLEDSENILHIEDLRNWEGSIVSIAGTVTMDDRRGYSCKIKDISELTVLQREVEPSEGQ